MMPLLTLSPEFEPLYQRSLEALIEGDVPKAAAGASRLVAQCPDFDGGWLLLSQAAQKEGNISLAVRAATQAISRNARNGLHYVQLGRCLVAVGKTEDALKTASKALELGPDTAEELDAVAMLFMSCGAYEKALPLQSRAADLAPENPAYAAILAIIHQTLGDLDRAADVIRSVLEIAPEHQGALAGLARLETASEDANIIGDLQAELSGETPVPEDREIRLRYALAKQLEDVGRYGDSFRELETASQLHRQSHAYDVVGDQTLVETLIELFPGGAAAAEGATSEAPIFIIGMPRSGTTLVERIVTSHAAVRSAGELHDFGLAALDVTERAHPGRYLDAAFARQIADADMTAIGNRYLERTARHLSERPRFVDKLPMNALYAGFISRALPNAKIIELRRHPVDVCFSNFKMQFRSGYDYSYDLEELAGFYIAYRRLTAHWEAILGPQYLPLSYEALVADQEKESRKLVAHLGLEWDDACLRFYDNKQAAATASSAQVRQPIYNKAVGRWRHYETQLAPLIRRLEEAGFDL